MHIVIVSPDPILIDALGRTGARIPLTTFTRAADLSLEQDPREARVLVVDWLLPDEPGVELCRKLRASSQHRALPIILLVGSCVEADKQLALEAGPNALLLKPFSIAELMDRINTVCASTAQGKAQLGSLSVSGIELDLTGRVARHRGRPVHLGAVDTRLLEFLMRSEGRLVSRAEIVAAVWADRSPTERAVDVHVARLRRALRAAWNADPIRTVRGFGYGLGAVVAPPRNSSQLRRSAPPVRGLATDRVKRSCHHQIGE